MNKKAMFIGCLLEVVREQYTDFYRGKERWRYLLPALSIRDLGTVNKLFYHFACLFFRLHMSKILSVARYAYVF